jgi:hypothetical protein
LSPGSKDGGLNTKKDPAPFAGSNTKMLKPSQKQYIPYKNNPRFEAGFVV